MNEAVLAFRTQNGRFFKLTSSPMGQPYVCTNTYIHTYLFNLFLNFHSPPLLPLFGGGAGAGGGKGVLSDEKKLANNDAGNGISGLLLKLGEFFYVIICISLVLFAKLSSQSQGSFDLILTGLDDWMIGRGGCSERG